MTLTAEPSNCITVASKVGKEKAVCNQEGAAAAIEKEKCEQIAFEVTKFQEDCERDLAAALPAVEKAIIP